MDRERLCRVIEELVLCHSPSGWEAEIDDYLSSVLDGIGIQWGKDAAGNLIASIPGKDSSKTLAITAHKDEIGGIVKSFNDDGSLSIRKLGGAFPWVYGEGVVDLLGDHQVIPGILSFGSRHVSHESPQKVHQDEKPLLWTDVRVDTKLSRDSLEAAGIRPGSRMVVGKHRKKPFLMGNYIASYTLDNKASLVILLALAEEIKSPPINIHLVASSKEEVGAIGAMYYSGRARPDALIALEICPKSKEYPIASDQAPVLLSQDGYGLYDEALNRSIAAAGREIDVPVQHAVVSGFGSDASIAMKSGYTAKAACLGFPTDNTHGYEIAHLDAIEGCLRILKQYCQTCTGL
ncbi:MAG: M20/M25/M40 family metallo-hydrolase [Methylococcaceae bacterium]|nr:M20/M25/M40 family metallo-hydrolase [Methylococcaceae bacterium]